MRENKMDKKTHKRDRKWKKHNKKRQPVVWISPNGWDEQRPYTKEQFVGNSFGTVKDFYRIHKDQKKKKKQLNRQKPTMDWIKIIIRPIFIVLIILGAVVWTANTGFMDSVLSNGNSAVLDIPTNSTLPTITPTPSYENYKTDPVTNTYTYVLNGNVGSISVTLYPEYVNELSKKSHTYYSSIEKEIIYPLFTDNGQDYFMETLTEKLDNLGSGDIAGKIAISLVQNIPYDYSKLWSRSSDWYYPYETLYHYKGVCSDKSILLAYLLKNLGYDVVLFEFPGHMAVGVKTSGNGFRNTGYAFIETTIPTIITYEPDTYIGIGQLGELTNTYYISKGGKSMNVEQERIDAAELKRLDNIAAHNNNYLSEAEYQKWINIANKYGLKYE